MINFYAGILLTLSLLRRIRAPVRQFFISHPKRGNQSNKIDAQDARMRLSKERVNETFS